MRTRRQVLGTIGTMVALAGCSSGTSEINSGPGLFAPGFNAQTIPERYTCAGGNISPDIAISDVSRDTEAFALIMEDANAPEPSVHWLIWDIPANTRTLPEGIPNQPRVDLSHRATDPGLPESNAESSVRQGTNSMGVIGYSGPCPPHNDGPHTYVFTLYSLRSTLDVPPGARRPALKSAIENARLAESTLTGTFDR